MPETEPFTFIETTAGEATAELARRGLAPDQRVIITIEPDDWLSKARAFSRPLIEAEGWTDEDIDRIIDEEREQVARELANRQTRAVVDLTAEEIEQMSSARMDPKLDGLNSLLDED